MQNHTSHFSVIRRNLTNWIRHHRLESASIAIIILVASILRLYQIDQYMTFLGDEGRDARVVMRLVRDFDPVLIGPMTSVTTTAGHMFLGPAYYYMMAPFMAITNLSPVGPAVMVALLSIVTTGMVWWFARRWFSPDAGLIAATLYAVSSTVINLSHSSWNPNIMPFFVLLAIWGFYQLFISKQTIWLIVIGICTAVMLQSHYLALIIIPLFGIYWLYGFYTYRQSKASLRPYIRSTIAALATFIILMSPLVIFDARHGWMNFKALSAFFTQRQTTVNLKVYRGFEKIPELIVQIFDSLLSSDWSLLSIIMLILISITCILIFIRKRRSLYLPTIMLLSWLAIALMGLGVYKQHIYDHYFGFIFPLPHLLAGLVIWQLWDRNGVWQFCSSCLPVRRIFASLLTFAIVYQNIMNTPIMYPPNNQFHRVEQIVEHIVQDAGDQPFNFALVSKSNYDESYRFVFERNRHNIVAIDPQQPETITDVLYVVCENSDKPDSPEDEKCHPIAHPQSEIALFGWAKINQEWQFPWGVKLYKLVHNPPVEENIVPPSE